MNSSICRTVVYIHNVYFCRDYPEKLEKQEQLEHLEITYVINIKYICDH